MADGAAKTAMYEQFARVGSALASPVRLELLDLLAQGERGVGELAAAAGLRLSNASAQLQVLADAGLIARHRAGRRVRYRLAADAAGLLAERVQQFAWEHLPGAERASRDYLGDVAALEPVSRDELYRRLQAGAVLVLDVRPAAEYTAAHIRGAMSIPHDQLPARLGELPAAEIVAYCRGRFCAMAPEAVRVLRRHGRDARPLDGGLPGWRRAGLPVAAGPRLAQGKRHRSLGSNDFSRTGIGACVRNRWFAPPGGSCRGFRAGTVFRAVANQDAAGPASSALVRPQGILVTVRLPPCPGRA